jgi:hypothetical protein
MSLSDVISRVTAIQQLTGQLTSPATAASTQGVQTAGAQSVGGQSVGGQSSGAQSSFADALTAATGNGTASAATTETTLLSSILEQSQAEALVGTLGSDDGDSTSPDPLDELQSLTALLPSTNTATNPLTEATGTTGATTSAAQPLLAAAESQVGVTEQPPGSNDGPQIATYRTAVAGAASGEPWCAYFVSWAAAQGGEPIGANGQGLGSVSEITDWASSTGRLLPPTATPAPGDLILFGDRHVGIVESVNPDGSLTTIEGNYGNAVTRVHRSPSEATGYVQMQMRWRPPVPRAASICPLACVWCVGVFGASVLTATA